MAEPGTGHGVCRIGSLLRAIFSAPFHPERLTPSQ
jgi:hypothetical protein